MTPVEGLLIVQIDYLSWARRTRWGPLLGRSHTDLYAPRAAGGSSGMGELSGLTFVAAAQNLDGGALEDGVAEADVRLGDLHPDGFHRRVLPQDRGGYPLGECLCQVDGRTLDDLLDLIVNLAVVHGLGQVVGEARGAKVEAKLHVHGEGLAQLALGGKRTVAAVEDHAFEQDPVLELFSFAVHPPQYRGP